MEVRPGRLAALAMTVLTVIASMALTAAPANAAASVRLGGIQYDSPGRDNRSNASLNAEWVKVVNTGRTSVPLKNWTLRDLAGHVFRFGNVTVGAGRTVVVHTGSGRSNPTHRYWNSKNYIWNNSGDTAGLRNPRGVRVDVCSWGDGSGLRAC